MLMLEERLSVCLSVLSFCFMKPIFLQAKFSLSLSLCHSQLRSSFVKFLNTKRQYLVPHILNENVLTFGVRHFIFDLSPLDLLMFTRGRNPHMRPIMIPIMSDFRLLKLQRINILALVNIHQNFLDSYHKKLLALINIHNNNLDTYCKMSKL